MFDEYFAKPFARRRLRAEPLGPYLEGFVSWLKRQGYPRARIRDKLSRLSFFNRWLRKHRLEVEQIDEEVVRRCIASRGGALNERYGSHTYRQFIGYLREQGVQQPLQVAEDLSPSGKIIGELQQYLLKERRVAEGTAKQYVYFVQAFLQHCFGDDPPQPETLGLGDLTDFLLSVYHSAPGQACHAATALRSFGRFLLARGLVEHDVSLGLPRVTRWHLCPLPPRLSRSEVERLLTSQDRRTEVGKRDYAILVIFARLGLRRCEVERLTLEDVNWRGGTLRVRGKGGIESRFPLVAEVGEGLADYLQVRPRDVSRRLFLTARAPRRPLGAPGIAHVVRKALRAENIRSQGGPHLLRHSLATELLHRGASLTEVGQVLQHRHPSTTEIYAKVRVEALRELALPWPETGDQP